MTRVLLFATLFTALIFPCALPLRTYGAEVNAGFVQGLWYGDKVLIAKKPTRVYVALRNNTDTDLTGTVRFTDNGTRIGVFYVSALPGRIVEAWTDWTPEYATHTIIATLSDVSVHPIGDRPSTAAVEDTLAQDVVFIDYDTDGDSIPNALDTDDDNDTVSDDAEIARGTNPLKADPIPKTEPESKPASARTDDTLTSDTAKVAQPQAESLQGLETYVPDGQARVVVEHVTNTLAETKNDLDTYRKTRSDAIEDYFEPTTTKLSMGSDSSATITRTRTEPKESFLSSVVRGGKALVSGVYTFILWILSNALGHPAILELLLLLSLIYLTYRLARRFGRRRN